MDKKLEARISRLEKLLKIKNEARLPDIGETVEDVNGDIAKVIDFGTLEDMYAKYKGRILNDEEVRDFVNVDGTSNYIPWEEWVAVIKYRDFNGMSIVTDPKYGLEIVESKKVVRKSVKNEDIAHDEFGKAVDLVNKATVATITSYGLITGKRKVYGKGFVNVHEYDPEVMSEYKKIVDDLISIRDRMNNLSVEFK